MDLFLDPNIAYFLLVFGFILAFLALLAPGTGLLEVGALFALVLSGWAVYNLPINLWALAILVLGVVPFILAVRRSGQQRYLILAIVALVIGTAFLFRGEGLRPAVNPALALITSVLAGGFLWFAGTKTLEATFSRPAHDLTGLVGSVGEARSQIHEEGSAYVAGELWTARSSEPIPAGTRIRVVGREGFLLDVERDDPETDAD